MNRILKKDEIFYDLARMLVKKFEEDYPNELEPDGDYFFTLNCLENVPPIRITVFTKESRETSEYYSAFAECGRKTTTLQNGEYLTKTGHLGVIENVIYEMLEQIYYVNVEEN